MLVSGAHEELTRLFAALRQARKELPEVAKSKDNFFGGKYMELDAIKEAVDPVLEKHGLYITQWPDQTSSGEPGLTTILVHEGGGTLQSTGALVMVKKDPQAQGSAITYMKRYAYVAILGIKGVEVDDDGNRASLPDSQITTKGEKVEGTGKASRAASGQKGELEKAATEKGWTKAKLTKWYHTEFGKDYKSDKDEQNLAAALVKIVTAPE